MEAATSNGKFRYNGRIGIALIPSLIVLSGFGGKVPVGIGLVGAMVTYMLDAMRYREGALGAVWATLGSVNLSIWVSGALFMGHRPFILSFMIGICSGISLFITGLWATLQFKSIQLQYPILCLAVEKILLATAFSDAAMVQSWGLIAAVGASHAPFYLLPVLCGLFYLLVLPLTTSFPVRGVKASAGGRNRKDLMVQAPVEGFCGALILTLLPASLYAVIHWSILGHWVHLWSLLLLASTPVLFLSVLEEGLWWLPGSPRQHNAVRQILCLSALATLIVAFEGRVVFPAFGQYIQLHPPWNYAAVTVALYGFAALALMYLGGLLGEALSSNLAGSVLIVSATLGSIAAGIPLPVLAAPLISAGGLALALESKQLRDYALFVVGGATTAAWFIVHHFWFLDVDLQGLSIQTVCILLWCATLPALILPGLIMAKAKPAFVSVVLFIQAILVAYLEQHLFLGADEVEGEMYPAAMVIATSLLGIAVGRRLQASRKIGLTSHWITQAIFVAKLFMLILPQANLPVPALLFVLLLTSPMMMKNSRMKAGDADSPAEAWLWKYGHILLVAVVTFNARNAVYEILHSALGARPSDGTLLGALLLTVVAGCIPLQARMSTAWRSARKVTALLGILGILLIALQPPLPLQGWSDCPGGLPRILCLRVWDARHTPDHDPDDTAVWGEFDEKQARWPAWILVGAAVSIVSTAPSPGNRPPTQSAAWSLIRAAANGLCIGAYIALEFFQDQAFSQIIITAATLAAALVLFGLRAKTGTSPALLVCMLSFWAAGFFLALLAQQVLPLKALPQEAHRFYADTSDALEQQRRLNNRAALLAVYTAEALLLAFAMKLKITAAGSSSKVAYSDTNFNAPKLLRVGNAYAEQAARFLGQCLPVSGVPVKSSLVTQGVAGAALVQLSSEGLEWLPSVSNMIASSCFLLSLLLSSILTEGSELCVFVLAPILLLMSQDQYLPALHSGRRYFVVGVAISSYLAASSLWQAFESWSSPQSLTNRASGSTLQLLKNLWLAGASLPSHVLCNQYLWSRRNIPGSKLLLFGPMNVATALFTNYAVVRTLAATGAVMSIGQYIAMSQMRREGMRLL